MKRTKEQAAYLREMNAAASDVLKALEAMKKSHPDSFAALSQGMQDDGYSIEETIAFMERLKKLK